MDLYSVMKTLPLMEEGKILSIVKALEKMASQSLATEDLKYAEPKDLYQHLELFQVQQGIFSNYGVYSKVICSKVIYKSLFKG